MIWGILFCLVGCKRDRFSSFVLVTVKSLLQIQRISYSGITLPVLSLYRTLEPQIHNTKSLPSLFLAFTWFSVPCVTCWCTACSGEIHIEGQLSLAVESDIVNFLEQVALFWALQVLEQISWISDFIISVCIIISKLVAVIIIKPQLHRLIVSICYSILMRAALMWKRPKMSVSYFLTSYTVDNFVSMNGFGLMYFSAFAILCNQCTSKCFSTAEFGSLFQFWLLKLPIVFIHCYSSRVARIRATKYLGFLRHISLFCQETLSRSNLNALALG